MADETYGGKIVIFGAGNIGRSFVGQLFSKGGYEVVFIDVDPGLIDHLNAAGEYRVVVKEAGRRDEVITVKHVRAVDGKDAEAVYGELTDTDIIATSVGKAAVPYILPVIAEGVKRRLESGKGGLDIIIAENIRSAAGWYRSELFPILEAGNGIDTRPEQAIGLVETSIGKMVPIMTKADRTADPLQVFAEAYNTLIVDAWGFRNGIPAIDGLKAVENIAAYVDRKLFVHNLGHAAAAYFGFAKRPGLRYLYEHLADSELVAKVRECMTESAAALAEEYPRDLTQADLSEHIDDLIRRFSNAALKDTVHRVGRDVPRKLGREDRLVGAMRLAARHHVGFDGIAEAAAAAFAFLAPDENGNVFPADEQFAEQYSANGVDWILAKVCGLNPDDAIDRAVADRIAEGLQSRRT